MLQLLKIYCTPNSSSATLNGKHFSNPNMHLMFCVQRHTAAYNVAEQRNQISCGCCSNTCT